jgi:hypothetical protein
VAAEISNRVPGAPQCELYWSEKRRDQAVLECAKYLRRYGDHLFRRSDALKREKPATAEEVRAGKAIFSLAGEGETRLVPGLALPRDARWATLKHRPYLDEEADRRTGKTVVSTAYRQTGRVVQAEEVFKDGKWQRYYGFVGCNRVARVPAEEVEFPTPEPRWRAPQEWLPIGGGLDARLEVPPLKVELIDDCPPRLPADAALKFGLIVRNARGLDQTTAAPDKSVRLRLLYSAETVSRQGALAPLARSDADWKRLTPKQGAAFQPAKARTLAPAEETKAATFDLRDRYELNKPGFYRVQLLPSDKDDDVVEVCFSLAPAR